MRVVVLTWATVVAACTVGFQVDEDAQITCAGNADCPSDWICNLGTGRCVSLSNPDTEPPSFLPPALLDPMVAGVGQIVTLQFATSEPLGNASVYFDDIGVRRDFVRGDSTEHEDPVHTYTHTLTYVPNGDESEGTFDLEAVITDDNDNELKTPLGVSLRLDFTSPVVVGSPRITVIPAHDNPLLIAAAVVGPAVALGSHAARGARVRVEIEPTEVLDPFDQITVRANQAETSVTFAFVSTVGAAFVYEGEVKATTPEGAYDIHIDMVDSAGNTGSHTATGAVTVDLTPPPTPDVETEGAIVYTRVPWGAYVTGGVPAYWVTANVGAVEQGGFLLGASAVDGTVGAVTAVDGINPTQLALPPLDADAVYLIAIDRAGNKSPVARVDQIRWIATLGGKVANSAIGNPNEFLAANVWNGEFEPPGANEAGERQGVASPSCLVSCNPDGVLVTTGMGYWMPTATTAPFLVNRDMAVAYDPGRESIIAFGGRDELYNSRGDLWQWDGVTWEVPYVSGSVPENRSDAAMAYDYNLGKIILFGGGQTGAPSSCSPTTGSACGDTWSWDGATWVNLGIAGPSSRSGHAMAFDFSRNRLILFGGARGLTEYNETWALNCTSDPCVWTRLYAGGANDPVGRVATTLVWDDANSQLLLHGGKGDYDALLSDLWRLESSGWHQIAADTGLGRYGHNLVFDASKHEILSWGVYSLFQNALDQTTCGRPWVVGDGTLACPPSAPISTLRDLPETASSYAFYFPPMHGVVAFGADYGTEGFLWQSAATSRPAHVFRAAFGLAAGGSSKILVERVNFQPSSVPGPLGYLVQGTELYAADASGRAYGWTCQAGLPQTNPEAFDDNEPSAPDQRYDTYVQMRYAEQVDPAYNCIWEYALDNGDYRLHLVVGSPRAQDTRRHIVTVEGVSVVDVRTSADQPFVDRMIDVSVADGRLTIGSGPTNSRLAFLEILKPTRIDAIEVSWIAGATGASYQGPQHILVYDDGDAYRPAGLSRTFASDEEPTYPARESLTNLVGTDPNITWDLLIETNDWFSPVSATFDSWCLTFADRPATPYCASPSQPLSRGQGIVSRIDLRGETLEPVQQVALDVHLSGTLNGVRLSLQTSATQDGLTHGMGLYGSDGDEWVPLAEGSASAASPGVLTWTSESASQASSFLTGPARILGLAIAPLGYNGTLSDGAAIVTDYVQVAVRYRISAIESD
ncbi:MAG: hypothetical protein A2341_06825 [Deltaproteobacteria bacterium RIFOXYB12_FULL_58_9]|nr:MAG: hypothetical protein A2341_06825 [Deltaproteobacteria bacterium RIFOXYB12_FULL_58_9]